MLKLSFLNMRESTHSTLVSSRFFVQTGQETIHAKKFSRYIRLLSDIPKLWTEPTKIGYRISANSFRGNYSFLEVGVRKLFKGGKYSREETILFLKKSEVETWILVAVKNWLHAWKIQWPLSNFVWILRLKAVLLPTKSTTVLFDNTLTSEDIMAASVNIFRGRDILKM